MGRIIQRRPTYQPGLGGLLLDILGVGNPSDGQMGALKVYHPRMKCQANVRPWNYVLDMSGFKPKDISVEVADGMVYVQGRCEVIDGQNVDLIFRKRCVSIPEYVNAKKIVCFLDRSGKFIIRAPVAVKPTQDRDEGIRKEGDSYCSKDRACHCHPAVGINTNLVRSEERRKTGEETFDEEMGHIASEKIAVNTETDMNELLDAFDKSDENKKEIETSDEVKAIKFKEKLAIDKLNTDEKGQETSEFTCSSMDNSIDPANDISLTLGDQQSPDKDMGNVNKERDEDVNATDEMISEKGADSRVIDENTGDDFYEVKLDVSQFPIGNVSVKCKEGTISIHAVQEDKHEGLNESQEFRRTFQLPNSAIGERASAVVNDDGLLTVKIPLDRDSSD